ncbi:MAG: cyclic nucleotide-binding domain-containing protein [Actinomycetota bacterium]|nr:cyclic nucleotide-binding domain-containing protein [Actinomycetota bacterium]
MMLERAEAYVTENPDLRDVSVRRARANERLAQRGEPDDTAFFLVDGTVVAALVAADGSRVEKAVPAPALVGELSALTGSRTGDLHVGEDGATLVAVGGSTFRLLCEDRAFAREYSRMARRRLLGDERRAVLHGGAERRAQLEALRLIAEGEQTEMLQLLVERLELTGGRMGRRTFDREGEQVIAEGEQIEEVLVIIAGAVRVPLPTGETVTAGPGSPLGEIAALSAVPRATASVFVDEAPVEVLTIPRSEFAEAVGDTVRRLATERVHRTFARSLPEEAQENLRTIRDQNTDALMLRTALDTVHSNSGIFGVLNPLNEPYEDESHHVGTIAQKYRLIEAVDRAMKAGMERPEMEALARRIAGESGGDTPATLTAFADAADGYAREWERSALDLYDPSVAAGSMDPTEFTRFIRRFERLRWLERLLFDDGAVRESHLKASFNESILEDLRGVLDPDKTPEEHFALLDEHFERLMRLGLTHGSPRVLTQLAAIRFDALEAEIKGSIDVGRPLPPSHPNLDALKEARLRLERGEQSAIGGSDYATQRFPRHLLDTVVRGDVPVVVFDGTRRAAIEYVRHRFGSIQTGALSQCMTTEVQGLDGSGGRTIVTFRDGRQVLVLSGLGVSRQLHNAGSILVYTDAEGRRVPEAHLDLVLATQGRDYVAEIRADLQRELSLDEPGLPTQLLILQNPKEFVTSQPEGAVEMRFGVDSVFDFYVAVATGADGERWRYVIPKVGGRGLYGDTAGCFVTAVFTAGIERLSTDVLFNGTAGGFSRTEGTEAFARAGARGLPDIRPGGYLMPLRSIEQYHEGEPIGLRTIVDDDINGSLLAELTAMGLNLTDDHVAVAAPAIETFDLIRSFLARGKASIDVEGGAIARAADCLRDAGLPVTFNPCYTHSDDPLGAEHDPDESLARMGPFFEGARLNEDMWAVLHRLLGAIRTRQRQGALAR